MTNLHIFGLEYSKSALDKGREEPSTNNVVCNPVGELDHLIILFMLRCTKALLLLFVIHNR